MEISYTKIAIRKKLRNTDKINKIIYEFNNLIKLTGSMLTPNNLINLMYSSIKNKKIQIIYSYVYYLFFK